MKHRLVMGILARLRKMRPGVCLLLAAGVATGGAGCTRVFYRKCADEEVDGILAEKDTCPAWKIEQYHVYPDERSRFADPSNPDRPPMPPDDEATYCHSPHPQAPGKAGVGYVQGTAWLDMIKAWDAMNREERKALEEKENAGEDKDLPAKEDPAAAKKPAPISGLTTGPLHPVSTFFEEPLKTKEPGFLLKLDQSVELGVINSPVYQNFREQLYEAALPVTLQRFNFAYQWAATSDWVRQWAGKDAIPAPSVGPTETPTANTAAVESVPSVPVVPNTNYWTGVSSLSFSKLFVSGALLTFDFVNTNLWNFVPPSGFTSFSTVNVNMTQPFLQGGGKAVTLEPLTETERTLFYSIRAYARFREQFFVNVAQGNSLPPDLTTAAGAGVGTNPISVLAALNIASTDVSGGFVSFLSTLYRECDMAADKKLVVDLQRALRIYEGYQEGGQFSPLQVDQVRSTLLQAQNNVLTDQQFVTNALDQFKEVLGLPANLPLILDDGPAREITRQLDRYYEVITDSDAAYKQVEQQEDLAPEKLRPALLRLYTQSKLVRGTQYARTLPSIWDGWARATDANIKARLELLRAERRKLLDRKTDAELRGETLSEKEVTRLRDSEIEADLGALEQLLREYEAKPWEKRATPELRRADRIKQFRLVSYSAEIVLVWARNERLETVGKNWPELAKAPLPGGGLDLSAAEPQKAQQEAVRFSLSNRWDLMNARAQLVDSWRQLRVTANALLGAFTVQGNLQSSTPVAGTHPFSFSTSRSAASLSLDTQLPLNRLAERNVYRTALINYQEQRRALITLEDNIAVQVRFDVRELQLFAANYRIQKRVLQSLYAQVESALEVITAPADPSALQATGTTGQANAAALTNQYLTALGSLNGAQTKMYDIWLSYQATRMQLYLDLESLHMDQRGVWMEEGLTHTGGEASGPAAGPPSPEGVPAPVPAAMPALPAPRPVGG